MRLDSRVSSAVMMDSGQSQWGRTMNVGTNGTAHVAGTYPTYCQKLTVKDPNGMVKELVFPKALDLDRPKRARTTFSSEQLYKLEQEFQRNQYLVGKERTELAKRLKLSETQVKVWFQNRRTKYKRDREREAEAKDSKAETVATQNILRLLQATRHYPVNPCPAPVPPSYPYFQTYLHHGLS
ncbi:ventral anterior homeobox 2-like [Haliotis rubra]|uniref:ventral anterior homeobox 2-like n=1 Tax=Haliotis rubra TaxID=36100 RepID=UPI001EE5C274|nr:ventral anterior homeobox 2-like [Haliotis rubra]